MTSTSGAVLTFLLAGVLACESEPPRLHSESDSLGIRVIQYGSDPSPDQSPRLATAPEFHVGWLEADPAFERVENGVILSDSSVAVADKGSRTITVLSPTGEIVRAYGGPGQGPGEIGSVKTLHRLPGDTIVLHDARNARISLFHRGEIIRTIPTNRHGGQMRRLMAIGATETGLVMRTAGHNPGFLGDWLKGVIVHFDLGSAILDTLAAFDYVQSDRARGTFHFAPVGQVGLTKDAFLVTRGDIPEVRRHDLDGNLFQVLRFPWQEKTVSDSFWSEYRRYFMTEPVTTLGPAGRASLFSQFIPHFGRSLPFTGRILGDDEGNAWVGSYSADYRTTAWMDAFSPDGKWIGRLALPARFSVLDIQHRRVLGVQYDDLGVNAVALFRIEGVF